MEALVHNLNTMHSRAGAQTPFSLHQLRHGHLPRGPDGDAKAYCWPPRRGPGPRRNAHLPHPHLPASKKGVNYNPGDPNYDLFKLACQVSRQAAVPQLLASWTRRSTCSTTSPAIPRPRSRYMGCRTRVMGNDYDPTQEIVNGRGNLSASPPSTCRAWPSRATATGVRSSKSSSEMMDLCRRPAADDRFAIQCSKKCEQLPLPDGPGRLAGLAKSWAPSDEVGEVLKHGTL